MALPEKSIPFLSNEGLVVTFPQELLQYTQFLEMLYRRHESFPIKTGLQHFDLQLTKAICDLGLLPCSHQTVLNPEGFTSFQELIDYVGITGDFYQDKQDLYLNDILSYLGLPEFCVIKRKKTKKKWSPTSYKCHQNISVIDQLISDVDEVELNRWIQPCQLTDALSYDYDYDYDDDDDWYD